ncbi:hypothetical protein [Zavarzinella formosa]|uniref:hypothetical protein n=1 Tax=Zavarzinella formosa TaxID=360055 RepID=UPI0002E4F2C5|nr:hypothetical protein [Zavarzinella formosa]
MNLPFQAARVPLAGLSALAGLRSVGHITVVSTNQHAWIRWGRHGETVVAALLAVPGVEWFATRDGQWFRSGEFLPAGDVPPPGESVPFDQVLLPAKFTPLPPGVSSGERVLCRLVPSDIPRPTSALRCPLPALRDWVENATTAELQSVRACLCDDRVLLIGEKLPWAEPAERFWGREVLVPLGYRPEPDWSEAALRETAGVTRDELLILTADHTEMIPRQVLEPLRRAAWRAVTAGG